MPDRIASFTGDNAFLSNFYATPVMYDGMLFGNAEAAFQVAKCANSADREQFKDLRPSEAKRLGRCVDLRSDWEYIKRDVMRKIVLDKFTRSPDLKMKLLATGNMELVEGNTWHDVFWGVDAATGKGENNLGKILMSVRSELAVPADSRSKRLTHLPQTDGLTEYLIPVTCTGIRQSRVRAKDIDEAVEKAKKKQETENRFSSDAMDCFEADTLVPELERVPQDDGTMEYLFNVHCLGVRYFRVRAMDAEAAVTMAEKEQYAKNPSSGYSMADFNADAAAPELALAPEDRATWPYWGYGWYGTDGIDWRSYRTSGGPGSIPDMADESWPIPPFDPNE